jgi:hypothetical protein
MMQRNAGIGWSLLAACLAAGACTDSTVPTMLAIEGTYRLTFCASQQHTPPCYTPIGSSVGSTFVTSVYVDSMAVVFHRDRTVRWTEWNTTTHQSCVPGSCSTPSASHSSTSEEGTYLIGPDSILVSLPSGLRAFHQSMPAIPSRAGSVIWSGPDTLVYNLEQRSDHTAPIVWLTRH